jgi:hypothetical protein
MNSLHDAYQAYERRVMRGEFDKTPRKTPMQTAPREPLLERFGDLLIHTGMRLKRRHAAGRPMAWSPMTGSKP